MTREISRRTFLKGLAIAVSVTPFGYKLLNASEKGAASFKPNVWFEITPDNKITVTVGNSEMGQGVRTALPMIIAEELEADWKRIRVVQGPAADPFKNPL